MNHQHLYHKSDMYDVLAGCFNDHGQPQYKRPLTDRGLEKLVNHCRVIFCFTNIIIVHNII